MLQDLKLNILAALEEVKSLNSEMCLDSCFYEENSSKALLIYEEHEVSTPTIRISTCANG